MPPVAGRPVDHSPIESSTRQLRPNTAVSVFVAGTNNLATLYANEEATVQRANPYVTDALGNPPLDLFMLPGNYEESVGGGNRAPISVSIADADLMRKSQAQTVTGANTFTDRTSASNVALRVREPDARRIVSTMGDDAHDGRSWGTAKRTPAAALASLPLLFGLPAGRVEGSGTHEVTSQLNVGPRCILEGPGRETFEILAAPSFPINTAVVRLNEFGCQLRFITVDCNNIAGSSGVYGEDINEQSGIFNVLVERVQKYGIQITAVGALVSHAYKVDDVEINFGSSPPSGAIGVYLSAGAGGNIGREVANVTVNGVADAALAGVIGYLNETATPMRSCHAERVATSYKFTASGVIADGLEIGPFVTDGVIIEGAGVNSFSLRNILPTTAPSSALLRDNTRGTVIPPLNYPIDYEIGSGVTGEEVRLTTYADLGVRFRKLSVTQALTQARTLQTHSAAGAVTIDASTANTKMIVLAANATSSTITNPTTGQLLTIGWQQDGTGGRSYVWPTNCTFANGNVAPTPTTTPFRTDFVTFVYTGSDWKEVSRAVNVG